MLENSYLYNRAYPGYVEIITYPLDRLKESLIGT